MKHPVKMISTKSTITKQLLEIAFDDTPWVPYYNFQAKPVNPTILMQDPFLEWLSSRYKFIAGVLKLPQYHQYDWHVDTKRGVGINMLLSSVKSYVFFTDTPHELVKNIYPHKYQADTYYLFNTQVPHMVINLNEPRYLFTLDFALDKDSLSFDQLRQDIRENYDCIERSD